MKLIFDLLHGTSHCVSYLQGLSVDDTLSVTGIHIRRVFAPALRLIYKTQTDYKIVIDYREKLSKSKLGREHRRMGLTQSYWLSAHQHTVTRDVSSSENEVQMK